MFCCLVSVAHGQFTQQAILTAPSNNGYAEPQGLALSADGNTAIVGDVEYGPFLTASYVFIRSGGAWTEQSELLGSDASGPLVFQGTAVALSADGNTALVGGVGDNANVGAAWVFTRSGGSWAQQGPKLVGSDAIGQAGQGWSVALSADGNTALVGGLSDNGGLGAAWVFTRSDGKWTQQGRKLVGSGAIGTFVAEGSSVALSADGNTALIGATDDNGGIGATWVFTRSAGVWSQQGNKLVGSDSIGISIQGNSVALSADGNTALVGGSYDNQFVGAAWVFTRSGGLWAQQGPKLIASGAIGIASLGSSAALSADGNTALLGGPSDNSGFGAAWVFTRAGGLWSQRDKLIGSVPSADNLGNRVALSADGSTALGSTNDYGAFVFVRPKTSTVTLSTSINPSLYGQSVTYTAAVTADATGAVTFNVDGVEQSTALLTGGQPQFSISNLSPGTHTISATYSGDPTFAPSTSNVVTQTVNPLGVISLWANTVVQLDGTARLPVSLANPAPSAGLTVSLTSSDPSKLTVTPSVFIPGGRTSPNVQPVVTGVNLGSAAITATSLGYTPATQSVSVTATLAFARCCVTIIGSPVNAVLSLSAPAPAGGLTIQLASDNPAVASVPATVAFPANATSVSLPISGVAAGETTIHAGAPPNLAATSIKVTVR
jgi:hypothetical protein